MFFDDDSKIELFIRTIQYPAAVRLIDGCHIIVNEHWENLLGKCQGTNLKELIKIEANQLKKTNLQHCARCDEDALHSIGVVFEYEVMDMKKYLTLRSEVCYKGKRAILILVVNI